jgi:hypothetical protein
MSRFFVDEVHYGILGLSIILGPTHRLYPHYKTASPILAYAFFIATLFVLLSGKACAVLDGIKISRIGRITRTMV